MDKNSIISFIIITIILIIVFGVIWFAFNNSTNSELNQTTTQVDEKVDEIKEEVRQEEKEPIIEGKISSDYEIQGMKIEVLKEGSGVEAKNGNNVFVHYTGRLENGEKFDSSLDRNELFYFVLGSGRVIKGWELGVLGMKIGEKRKLTIPPELGYGDSGVGGVIPPNAVLIFEVELFNIK